MSKRRPMFAGLDWPMVSMVYIKGIPTGKPVDLGTKPEACVKHMGRNEEALPYEPEDQEPWYPHPEIDSVAAKFQCTDKTSQMWLKIPGGLGTAVQRAAGIVVAISLLGMLFL
jgi:hypothetical protein